MHGQKPRATATKSMAKSPQEARFHVLMFFEGRFDN